MTDLKPAPIPETARRGFAVPLLVFAVSVLVQIATLSRHLDNIYDEGLILLAAQRILEGDVPYRDFWGLYAPGQFYAVAALFKLFGSTILIEELWDVAIRAGIVTMVFLWSRRLGAGFYSHAAWIVALVLLSGFGARGFPVMHALLFALMSAYLVLDALESARPAPRLIAAGALAGIAALFRHDMGFYTVIAEALLLAWWAPRRAVRAIVPLALGAGAVVGAAAVFLLAQVPARDLWFNLVVAPSRIYPQMRRLPFPSFPDPRTLFSDSVSPLVFNDGIDAYVPLFAAAAALIWLVATARAGASDRMQRAGVLLLVLLTLALYLKGLVRTHNIHLMQSVIPAVALIAVLLGRMRRRIAPMALGALIAAALMAWPARVAFAAFAQNVNALRQVRNQMGLRLGLPHLCAAQPGLERARCFVPRADDAKIALFIESRTRPDEPVYVGPSRHDRIFVNNILLQYLMARPAATKWHESHPGIQTTEQVQREMIAEFTARSVRYLVLSAEWEGVREPNASAVSSGVTLLDDYIKANYEVVETFGAVAVWRRR